MKVYVLFTGLIDLFPEGIYHHKTDAYRAGRKAIVDSYIQRREQYLVGGKERKRGEHYASLRKAMPDYLISKRGEEYNHDTFSIKEMELL